MCLKINCDSTKCPNKNSYQTQHSPRFTESATGECLNLPRASCLSCQTYRNFKGLKHRWRLTRFWTPMRDLSSHTWGSGGKPYSLLMDQYSSPWFLLPMKLSHKTCCLKRLTLEFKTSFSRKNVESAVTRSCKFHHRIHPRHQKVIVCRDASSKPQSASKPW